MIRKRDKIKTKKAMSIMIGYVLLISAAVFMSFIVYAWMKSYIPQEKPECPDDVSIVITDITVESQKLKVSIKNTGLFSIHGYILTGFTEDGDVVSLSEGYYYFKAPCDPDQPNNNAEFPQNTGENTVSIKRIEIIPIRSEKNEEETKDFVAVCGDAKISRTFEDAYTIKEPSS